MKMNKWFAWVLILALLLAAHAPAEESMDARKKVQLIISFQENGAGIPDANFSIYRVADLDTNRSMVLSSAFERYNVKIEHQSESEMAGIASTLAGYVLRDQIAPAFSGVTDPEGMLSFSGEQLKQGLYLLMGQRHVYNGRAYTFQPALVQLPMWNAADARWDYDVEIKPKYEANPDTPDAEKISRKVLKVWKDCEGVTLPKEITVQLLRDGAVFDTVKLNAEMLWRHTWTELDANHQWTVVEKEMEDYNVLVTQEGITFVVTNAYDPKDPSPTPTPKPTATPSDGKGSGGSKLPQTGQLWWPIPMLVSVGLLLIVVGLLRRRGH